MERLNQTLSGENNATFPLSLSPVNGSSATLFVSNDTSQRMAQELIAPSLLNAHQIPNSTAATMLDFITAEEVIHEGDPKAVLIAITIVYSLIFLVGLVGNIITCTVISRNKSMHTAINYYLFNLAITDMLILLSGMPFDLYNAWNPSHFPFGGLVCMLQALLAETSTNVTILTISSFTVERYIAICHPFRQQAMSKLSRAIKFIVGIWLFAFAAALPQACQFSVADINGDVLCIIKNRSISYAFTTSSLIFFVAPMTLICVLYVLIGLKLRQSSLLMSKFSHRAPVRQPPRNNSSSCHSSFNQTESRGRERGDSTSTATTTYAPQKPNTTPKKSQRRIIKMLSEFCFVVKVSSCVVIAVGSIKCGLGPIKKWWWWWLQFNCRDIRMAMN